MRVNLLTDLPRHNLALMRISQWHKSQGDEVTLNMPLQPCDLSYGSWFFSQKYQTDIAGGPAVDPKIRLYSLIQDTPPDYDLYPNIDYSLGFTWDYCPRKCDFCIVPKQNNLKVHRSIKSIHNPKFKKICLLNNNTFSDPKYYETFYEIWQADLTVHDENGYDLRLMNAEKANALADTRFDGLIHFAWDSIKDEEKIITGLEFGRECKLHNKSMVYVLTGYNTTLEEDIYRCQKIHDLGYDPFIMLYNDKRSKQLRQFRRMINGCRYYRSYKSIAEAWVYYK